MRSLGEAFFKNGDRWIDREMGEAVVAEERRSTFYDCMIERVDVEI